MTPRPSPIRANVEAMTGYVPGEQPKTPDIVKLNTNENPYPPSPAVARAIADALGPDADTLRRYPDPVATRLRQTIADLHGCALENVFAGNGSDEVLALCTRAFPEHRTGTVGWLDPSYSLYPILSQIEELQFRPVPLDEHFQWMPPADYDVDLFFFTQPNAPTSLLTDTDAIRDFARTLSGVLLIDEAYADFADSNCLSLALSEDNVLVSRSLSKSYSLAALRVGYCIGSPRLIEALYKIKDSYNLNLLTQVAATAALEDRDTFRANTDRILATRARVTAALETLGWFVFPSQTNFLWTRPPAAKTAADWFAHFRSQNIIVRYFPADPTGAYLRVSTGTDPEMDRFLAACQTEF